MPFPRWVWLTLHGHLIFKWFVESTSECHPEGVNLLIPISTGTLVPTRHRARYGTNPARTTLPWGDPSPWVQQWAWPSQIDLESGTSEVEPAWVQSELGNSLATSHVRNHGPIEILHRQWGIHVSLNEAHQFWVMLGKGSIDVNFHIGSKNIQRIKSHWTSKDTYISPILH